MINLLEGVPGSGKSYEAVVYHVLPALQSGRKVITNLPLKMDAWRFLFPSLVPLIELRKAPMPVLGRWDAEAANRGESAYIVGKFDGEATGKTSDGQPCQDAPKDARLFGAVWDFYSTWRGKDNIGPLYVIDECHVSFPKATRRRPQGTPEEVIQWFKISRHFGADVLLMTQRMGALDEDIAGLAEFHVRVRKAAFLGRPKHYIRKTFAGLRGGEVSSEEREYLDQYFPLYKSHTQGSTVREAEVQDVAPDHLKWQRRSRIFIVVGLLMMVWVGYRIFFGKPKPPAVAVHAEQGMQRIPLGSSPAPAAPQVASKPAAPVQVDQPEKSAAAAPGSSHADAGAQVKDPLSGKQLHVVGDISKRGKSVVMFVVSDGSRRMFEVSSDDLQDAGYTVKRLATCMVTVRFEGTVRPVTCDAPYLNTGGQDRPLVIDTATGARSDGRAAYRDHGPMPHEVAQVRQDQQQQASSYLEALARRNAQVRSNLIDKP